MAAFLKFTAVAAALHSTFVAGDSPPVLPSFASISYSGNGCPNNADSAGDFNNPTFTFRNYVASCPGNARTVNCEVHLQTAGGSAGWQVSLSDVDVKGHVLLEPGVRLKYYTQVYFSQDAGNTATASGEIYNDGRRTLDYTAQIHQGTPKVWSPCIGDNGSTGILNVNFRVALTGDGRGTFEGDTESWRFDWRRC